MVAIKELNLRIFQTKISPEIVIYNKALIGNQLPENEIGYDPHTCYK